ncbi:MAG: biotin synthase BioB [Planctomycetaceae bacterium]|nr:biotin synthase BioB [Planctomycetaceae bacterium]
MRSWNALAEAVLEGHVLSIDEARSILDSPDAKLPELLAAAYRVRRRHFDNRVQLYYLKNAKSGLCAEDCGYCSQAKTATSDIPHYTIQNEEKLLEGAREAAQSQAGTYCIVASGRGPTRREIDHVTKVVRKIKSDYGLHICCCLGLLDDDQARQLKAAGVDRINHNLNTSERFYPEVCSTHSFQDRLETLKTAREAGLELCSGVIIGMGETLDDVVDVALQLSALEVSSIPVNFLNAIDGTALEGVQTLNPRMCLKALCLFRLANPATEIRVAGGREVNLRSLQPMALYAANSLFVSDYLTTQGQSADEDFRMIEDLGFEVECGDPEIREMLEQRAAT